MTAAAFPFVLPVTPAVFACEDQEPETSGLTGKPLRRRYVAFTVAGEARNDAVTAALDAAAAGAELVSDTEGGRWKVGNRTFSYQAGQAVTMYNHRITFIEQEELVLTAVEIDGMTLTPDRWKIGEGDNVVTFLADLNAEESQRFNQILERYFFADGEQRYFPARLIGVSDSSGRWRFGECLWEWRDDGSSRHLVILVPEAYDATIDGEGFSLFQPERMRVMQQSMTTKMRLDALIKELGQAGVLGTEAIARINAELSVFPFAEAREFSRANKVDEFFD
jgi:hypothetical protein